MTTAGVLPIAKAESSTGHLDTIGRATRRTPAGLRQTRPAICSSFQPLSSLAKYAPLGAINLWEQQGRRPPEQGVPQSVSVPLVQVARHRLGPQSTF
jgi:hypothetical protein